MNIENEFEKIFWAKIEIEEGRIRKIKKILCAVILAGGINAIIFTYNLFTNFLPVSLSILSIGINFGIVILGLGLLTKLRQKELLHIIDLRVWFKSKTEEQQKNLIEIIKERNKF